MVESKARWKRLIAFMLAFAMVFSSIAVSSLSTVTVQAASSKKVNSVKLKIGSKDVTQKTFGTTLYNEDQKQLKVTASPKNAVKKVTYKSAKPKIAYVNRNGVITGKRAGTAKINVTVKGKDNKKTTTWLKVKVKNVKLSLNKKSVSVTAGKTATLKATCSPSKTVKWSTSNKKIATVSSKGVVKGVNAGTATITASRGVIKETCKVTVKESGIPVTGVEVASSELEVSAENIEYISANVTPANATDKTLTYTSEDETVATVDGVGAVFGVKEGTTTITVSSKNGKTATVDVTVVRIPLEGLEISPASVKIGIDEEQNLAPVPYPEKASVSTYTWSSNKASVATVDENGKVKGVAEGTAVITATAPDYSGIVGQCTVEVTPVSDMTMTLVNPYKIDGTEIENTVLYGDDMHISVEVKEDGQPVADEKISLRLTRENRLTEGTIINDNAGSGYCYEVKTQQQYTTTDSNGKADFVVGLKDEYRGNVFNGTPEVYAVRATRINDKGNGTHKELKVNTATIGLTGIKVENQETAIKVGDNATEAGWTYENAVGETKVRTNNTLKKEQHQDQQYVINQQVSPETDTSNPNKVELSASPVLNYGLVSENRPTVWSRELDGSDKDKYSTYNSDTNLETTTQVLEIPSGISYLTVNFNEINLSDYTRIVVTLKNANGSTKEERIITKGGSTHLQFAIEKGAVGKEHRLIVSVESQGRKDPDEKGYALSSVIGEFAETGDYTIDTHPIESTNLVTWEDVTDSLQYDTYIYTGNDINSLASYSESLSTTANSQQWNKVRLATICKNWFKDSQDAAIDLYGVNRIECRIPTFPYVGDAFITIIGEGKVKAGTYAWPSENLNLGNDANPNYQNVNVLSKQVGTKKPILLTDDEANERRSTKDAQRGATLNVNENNNHAVVNSIYTGVTALKATINLQGISEDIFSARNGKDLYTSIQWAPYPTQTEASTEKDFYAVEGQRVKIEAQITDGNGNPQTYDGAKVIFKWTDTNYDKDDVTDVVSKGVDGSISSNRMVTVETDANGKATLLLRGSTKSFIKAFNAEASDAGKYRVKLNIIDSNGINPSLPANAEIYWVDLGLSYRENVNDDKTPVVNWDQGTGYTKEISIATRGGKDPVIGYKPVSKVNQSSDGWNLGIWNEENAINANITYSLSNNKWTDNPSSPEYNQVVSGNNISITATNQDNYLKEKSNNVALLHSDEIGAVDLEGILDYSQAGLKDIKFTYKVNNKTITKDNIGIDQSITLPGNILRHTIRWKGDGISLDYPDRATIPTELTLDMLTSISKYVKIKVSDSANKAYSFSTVNLGIRLPNNIDIGVDSVKTDKDGVAILDEAIKNAITKYNEETSSTEFRAGKIKIDINSINYANSVDGTSGELYGLIELTFKSSDNTENLGGEEHLLGDEQPTSYMNEEVIQ